MIVLDTSVAVALKDLGDERHPVVARWYGRVEEELVTTPLVLAETDLVLRARLGSAGCRALRRDVATGALLVEWWPEGSRLSAAIAERYDGLGLSLTDASLVALASRLATDRIATLDERHFRAVRPVGRSAAAFRLLPVDDVAERAQDR